MNADEPTNQPPNPMAKNDQLQARKVIAGAIMYVAKKPVFKSVTCPRMCPNRHSSIDGYASNPTIAIVTSFIHGQFVSSDHFCSHLPSTNINRIYCRGQLVLIRLVQTGKFIFIEGASVCLFDRYTGSLCPFDT